MIKESTQSESSIVFMEGTKDDPNKRKPDISLAKQELGWEPTVHVKDVSRQDKRPRNKYSRESSGSDGVIVTAYDTFV